MSSCLLGKGKPSSYPTSFLVRSGNIVSLIRPRSSATPTILSYVRCLQLCLLSSTTSAVLSYAHCFQLRPSSSARSATWRRRARRFMRVRLLASLECGYSSRFQGCMAMPKKGVMPLREGDRNLVKSEAESWVWRGSDIVLAASAIRAELSAAGKLASN